MFISKLEVLWKSKTLGWKKCCCNNKIHPLSLFVVWIIHISLNNRNLCCIFYAFIYSFDNILAEVPASSSKSGFKVFKYNKRTTGKKVFLLKEAIMLLLKWINIALSKNLVTSLYKTCFIYLFWCFW